MNSLRFENLSEAKIEVFDSGIGGTTTLREIRKLLPSENFVYLGDSKNCPYGEKTDAELFQICRENVLRLISEKVKIIVVACNTATTRALPKLREEFSEIDFIGTEPALKPAVEAGFSRIVVLATPMTAESLGDRIGKMNFRDYAGEEIFEDSKFRNEKSEKNDPEVEIIPCPGLAKAIEERNDEKVNQVLAEILKNKPNDERKKIEAVVLGCTHYPIVKEKIQAFFPNAEFFDGNIGVAKRVKEILTKKNILNPSDKFGEVEYIFT